eukprot:scaffold317240_cov31-Tisochrysis_lutea.AAC.2
MLANKTCYKTTISNEPLLVAGRKKGRWPLSLASTSRVVAGASGCSSATSSATGHASSKERRRSGARRAGPGTLLACYASWRRGLAQRPWWAIHLSRYAANHMRRAREPGGVAREPGTLLVRGSSCLAAAPP